MKAVVSTAVLGAAVALAGLAASGSQAAGPGAARYGADGKLQFPQDYRTWVYLTTGMDMSYAEAPGPADRHLFDSVFVDPAAYAGFQKTGRWPDGTVMVLELRRAAAKGSINKRGQFQTDRLAVEAHVKDSRRFKSGWAFYSFPTEAAAEALPQTSDCNACHEKHGAVDTTFVQFYPTLIPVAQAKNTFSASYLAEEKVAVK